MGDRDRENVYSKRVRAGKRTCFSDVKAIRDYDYYLILPESRRQPRGDEFSYDKQKLFPYKEDVARLIGVLHKTIDYVRTELIPDIDFAQFERREEAGNEMPDGPN